MMVMYLLTPLGIMLTAVLLRGKMSRNRQMVPLIALAAGMIAYCVVPKNIIDISRYWMQLERIRGLPISDAFTWTSDGLLLKNLVFWLVAQTGDNHILPFLTMGTIYGVSAYIVIDAQEKGQYDTLKILLTVICLLPFYNVFSNVRNVTSFALILLAVYRDLWQRKRNIATVLLYVLPCFFHMTGFVVVLFRLAVILVQRFPRMGTLLTLGIPTAAVAVYERVGRIELPGAFGAILSRAIWKAYSYTVGTSEYSTLTQTHGSFIASRIVAMIYCTGLMLCLYSALRHRQDSDVGRYRYKVFLSLVTMLTIIWAAIGVVKFWVFFYLVCIASIPFAAELTRNRRQLRRWQIYGALMLQLAAVMEVVLQVRTIYTYLDHGAFANSMITTNYVTVIIHAILGVS